MAPLWYRPVLRTQAGFLDLIFGKRQEQAAKRLAEMGPEGAANWTVNRIGGLSAERAAPGEVEGWVMAQHTARYA